MSQPKDIWGPRACPRCGAEPGVFCVTSSGRRAGLPHRERWPEGPLRVPRSVAAREAKLRRDLVSPEERERRRRLRVAQRDIRRWERRQADLVARERRRFARGVLVERRRQERRRELERVRRERDAKRQLERDEKLARRERERLAREQSRVEPVPQRSYRHLPKDDAIKALARDRMREWRERRAA